MRYHIVSTYDLETDDDGGQHCDGESTVRVLLGIPDTLAEVPDTVRHGLLGRYRSVEPPGTLVVWTSLLESLPVTIIMDPRHEAPIRMAELGSSSACTLGVGWWAHYDTDGRRLCAGNIDADGCRPDHSAIVHGTTADEQARAAAFRLTFPREGRPSVEFITETET